jgi:pre-mRNA-splicing factor ISY1
MEEQENYQVPLPSLFDAELIVGVKELLESAKPLPSTKKQREELRRNVDADYYGYRDEEDGLLLQYEEAQEEISMGHTIMDQSGEPQEGWTAIGDVSEIPRRAEVEKWLVERRKRRLIERYGG